MHVGYVNIIQDNWMFFCQDCRTVENCKVAEDMRPEPLKTRILRALGLDKWIIDSLLIKRKKAQYGFSRSCLTNIQTDICSIPVIHIPLSPAGQSTLFLYSHGRDSNLNDVYRFLRKIQELYMVAVIGYDYTGYGQSKMATGNILHDVKAVFSWAVTLGYRPQKIIMAGFSVGSIPALSIPGPMPRCLLAPISGVVSLVEGQVHHYQNDPYDNIQAAKLVQSRVFMVHSLDDRLPVEHSRILYRAMTENRTEAEKMKIQYYEVCRYSHSNLPSYLIDQQNKNFVRFLEGIRKDSRENNEEREKENMLLKTQPHVKSSPKSC